MEADDNLLRYTVLKIVLKTRMQKLVLKKGRHQYVNEFLSVVKQYSVLICTTTSLAAFLMFRSESSETGIWKILLQSS